jgi:predicted esterase
MSDAFEAHHLKVHRSSRHFVLGADPAESRELVIGLHGYAQLADRFLRWLAPLDDGGTCLVAPEALSRFYLETGLDGNHGPVVGATWLTREDRDADLADHVHYLDSLVQHLLATFPARPRVTVLGFSQGSVMAARWLVRSRWIPDQVILWGTPLPADVTPEVLGGCRHGRPLVLAGGDRDPLAPPGRLEEDVARLQAQGVAATVQRFAGGHSIPAPALLEACGRS